jgi:hypothetical protein
MHVDRFPAKRGLMPTTLDTFRSPYRLLVVANEALDTDAAPARDVVDLYHRTASRCSPSPASAGWLERWTSTTASPDGGGTVAALPGRLVRRASRQRGSGRRRPAARDRGRPPLFDADRSWSPSALAAVGRVMSDLAEQVRARCAWRVGNPSPTPRAIAAEEPPSSRSQAAHRAGPERRMPLTPHLPERTR